MQRYLWYSWYVGCEFSVSGVFARKERIPLLRTGFPVADRFGYHRKPMLGYNGALRLVEEAANLLVGDCYG